MIDGHLGERGDRYVNIMDKTVKDSMLQSTKWPLLDHVNRYQLYLQALYISYLSSDGVTTMDKGCIDGTTMVRNHPTLDIPKI